MCNLCVATRGVVSIISVGRPLPVPSHRHRRSREPEPSESFQQFSSASAVTGRRGRRSREPEPSQSPSSSLGHGDRREQQQQVTVFADFFSVSFIVFIFLFCYFGKVLWFKLKLFAPIHLLIMILSLCFVEFTINCSEWMNEWISVFACVLRGTEIWMHSGEPLSGYLARPPYLQKCRRGREPEPSRSVQQPSRLRRWQGRRSREPEPQRHIRMVLRKLH